MPSRCAITLLATAILALPAQAAHPVIIEHCTKCHGGAKQKGGLDLRSTASALAGGESGPALVPGKPEESRLLQAVQPGADPHMPPKDQLSAEAIAALGSWITDLPADAGNHAESTKPAAQPPAVRIPDGIDPSLAVDLFIQAGWRGASTPPAPRCDDASFVRRTFLDLLGRIPTTGERDAFLAGTDSAKRESLVDNLLASPGHAAHMAEIFNVVFLDREDGRKRKRGDRKPWLDYLHWAFTTNRPWDQVARDLLIARPQSEIESGASWFLYEQGEDHQQMATRTSATLLGKQVQCAQCHDHPVSPEIEQRHYWGLVAFFSRSINVKTPGGPRVAERASGGYAKFSNLKGDSSDTELVMLSGTQIEEPDGRHDRDTPDLYSVAPPDQWFAELKKDEKLNTDLTTLPVPKFSRREAFATSSTAGNPDFSRAIVNRIWALVFGRGLVHPIDRMDSAHPASHPELLDWLASDFATNGYDVRRLIRALVNSNSYQLDSPRATAGAGADLPPQDWLFARPIDKPLSAEAFYRSMRVAAGYGADGDEGMRSAVTEAFPALFAEVYSPSVQQALFVTNGELIDQLLSDEAPLIAKLTGIDDPGAVAREGFLAILGRAPDDIERTHSIGFLTGGPPVRIRQFCWALMAGSEFRINH